MKLKFVIHKVSKISSKALLGYEFAKRLAHQMKKQQWNVRPKHREKIEVDS